MSQIFDTPEDIEFVQLAARKGALELEIAGMHRRGRSAYSICKSEYGLRGSRERVLAQLEAMIEERITAKRAERGTLYLIDPDQGVCPDGHPCRIKRATGADPFLRECDTDHPELGCGFRSMPLIREGITAEDIDAAESFGANARLVEWARSYLADTM